MNMRLSVPTPQRLDATYQIYKKGTSYVALNGDTGNKDYSGSALHTVLQNAIDKTITDYGHGSIYFVPGATYSLTSGVSKAEGGIFLFSDGAKLDLTNLNNTVFDFGEDGTFRTISAGTAFLTGMSGFLCEGATANTSTKLIIIRNECNTALVQNISFNYLANVVEIRGGCYSAIMRDIRGAYTKGTFIKTESLATGGGPNHAIIDHCQNSNAGTETTSTGIYIGAANGNTDSIIIRDCWLEKHNIEIDYLGDGGTIGPNNFIQQSPGANPKGISIRDGATYVSIVGNHLTAEDGQYAIYNNSDQTLINIQNNMFDYIGGTCIYNATTYTYGNIVGNSAHFQSAGAQSCFLYGPWSYSTVCANRMLSSKLTMMNIAGSNYSTFVGNTFDSGDVASAVGVAGSGTYNMVSGNSFLNCLRGWDDTGFTYTNIIGNSFAGCTTDIDDLDGTSVQVNNMS